jgi:hypothetical protein
MKRNHPFIINDTMAASKRLLNPIKEKHRNNWDHVVGILKNEANWLYIEKSGGIRK